MSPTWNPADHPRGHASNAGRFADKVHSAPEATLGAHAPDWGEVHVAEGARTPWGEAQHVNRLGPGAVFVGTAGHGGVKLSKERLRTIPPALRFGSWFEEDCEVSVVGMYHPDLFPNSTHDFEQSVKDWFPDQYEKSTGRTLQPGESRKRDEDLWMKAHHDHFVTTAARHDDAHPGFTIVHAKRASDGTEVQALIPSDEYRAIRQAEREPGQTFYNVIDPTRYELIPEKVRMPAPRHTALPALDGLTAAARARVEKDLRQRWRDQDGRVRSLAQIIAEDGITQKTVWVEGGTRRYSLGQRDHVEDSSSTVYSVSKATFDAFEAVPDARTELQKAQQDLEVARHGYDRRPGGLDPAAHQRLAELNARVDAARTAAS